MPSYKLGYFNARGRAEICRYIFAVNNADYEDLRFDGDTWRATYKASTPFGVAPFLEVDGKMISDSGAMMRFLGRQFGMMGGDSFETALIDQTLGVMEDVIQQMFRFRFFIKDEAEKKIAIQKFSDEMVPKFFKYIEDTLRGSEYLATKLSVADLGVFYVMELLESMGQSSTGKVKEYFDRIAGIDSLAEWRKKRPVTEN